MHHILNEKVSVVFLYSSQDGRIMPKRMRWQGQTYDMTQLAYHHKVGHGRAVQHVFHVTDGHLDFRLRCDSDNLHWTLEEVTDGN